MNYKKIIWLDVGTHFGQEYNSIFGSNFNFYIKIIKRFINVILKRQKSINLSSLQDIIHKRAQIKKKSKYFYSIFIEANPKIIFKKKFYLEADMIFNIALNGENNKPTSITKLYLGKDGELSQSSSIFLSKKNLKKNSYVTTLGMSGKDFFNKLKLNLNKKFINYDILLRLNCEGVEDDIIYSAHSIFGKKLKLICGALKDVKDVKGVKAYKKLHKFILNNELSFFDFHTDIESWSKPYNAILNMLKK